MDYENVDEKIKKILKKYSFSFRENEVREAVKKWEEARLFQQSLLKSKKKNKRKDLNYSTRKKFFIPISLIEKNPTAFIRKVNKWFKNPARYDIEGIDGGVLDDDIYLAYIEGLKGKRRKEVLLNKDKIGSKIYRTRGVRKKKY